MLYKNTFIYICYALILTTYPFELIGSDKDPETGEKIKTNEESETTKEKYSLKDHIIGK